MKSAQDLSDLKPDISCQHMNSGGFCDICKKVRIEISVIHSSKTRKNRKAEQYRKLLYLNEKKMQVWVAIDPEEKQIVAVCVTQIAVYPQEKACWVLLVGGSFLDDLLPFINILKLWAKESGCGRILSYSRDGWIKKAAPFGFKKLRTLISCSLEDDNENL